MAFVPFLNVAQIEMRYDYDGQKVENVYHVSDTSGLDADTLLNMAAAMEDWWTTRLAALCSTHLSLIEIVARDLTAEGGTAISYSTGMPIFGSSAGAQLPNNVTAAVKWNTARSGRSYRGRTYHLGLNTGHVVGNRLTDAVTPLLAAAYNFLVTDLVDAGFKLVVASRVTLGSERAVGVATDITSATVDNTVDSQRRRLPGRGN